MEQNVSQSRAAPLDCVPVRIRKPTHRLLKIYAAQRGETMIEYIDYLLTLAEKEERGN